MDTTKTYIKMCEKAEKIQELADNDRDFEWERFGFCITHNCLIVTDYDIQPCCSDRMYGDKDNPCQWVWLPTQGQLQEMVKDYDYWIELSHYEINGLRSLEKSQGIEGEGEEYEGNFPNLQRASFASMEQLWLAFVMKENYNKIWNGKDWNEAN